MTRTGRRDAFVLGAVLVLGVSLIAEQAGTPSNDGPDEVECPGGTVESDGPQFACWLARP